MELNHLKTFLVVAEEMNFGRAAERLHIAQPPLSRQIKRLEESLGVQLFHRTKPQIQLTEAGRALVLEARRILKQVDLGVQVTQRASRGEIGQIILGFEGFSSADIEPLAIVFKYNLAFFIAMRYTEFFASCLFPLSSFMLPATCSLKPITKVPHRIKNRCL
ncbi:MAG: LysR family transcriptional regulator [Moorea sp. SIO4E2]|nr:LysR family transcriptional regulator [Moorena sp. SIO3A5]NEQ04985.1 LysR family transcriptional regulator [Moorena sp. SIO4E2]